MRSISCYKFLITGLALVSIPLLTIAGSYAELPRNIGALEIGMSEQAFTQMTGIRPETCAICIKKETFATLSGKQLATLDAEGDGADVFFYDRKLYLISLGTIAKDLFTIKEDFEQTLGGPGIKLSTSNGIAKLKWEDLHSIITLNYHEKDKSVFSVNYYDWELKQERDWRETQTRETAVKETSKEKKVAITE